MVVICAEAREMGMFESMPYVVIKPTIDSKEAGLRAALAEAAEGESFDNMTLAFQALLAHGLEDCINRPMTPATTGMMQSIIDQAFAEAQYCRAVLMFAEGAVYVGAKPIMKPELYRYDLRWKTDFWMGERWTRQQSAMPLGFFGNYDLYIGFQEPLPPTLVARYGNGGGDYMTFNPYLQGEMWPSVFDGEGYDALREALLRARSAGWFDDLG